MIELKGGYDLHVHASPDVCPRKFTDIELAKRLIADGFAGMGLKCHYAETAGRAALLRELFPEFQVAGGITLNRSLGGFNPYAVEACGKMGGKFVWLPTMDARSYKLFHNPQLPMEEAEKLLYALDDEGQLLASIHEVLEVAAQYKMIVCTGHLSAKEGLVVLNAAKEHGVEHFVITHGDNPADIYSSEQQRQAVRQGAVVEHCYFTVFKKRTPIEAVVEQMRAVGFDHTFISTDFGQVDNPYPEEGLQEFLLQLSAQGVADADLEKIFKLNIKVLLQ